MTSVREIEYTDDATSMELDDMVIDIAKYAGALYNSLKMDDATRTAVVQEFVRWYLAGASTEPAAPVALAMFRDVVL